VVTFRAFKSVWRLGLLDLAKFFCCHSAIIISSINVKVEPAFSIFRFKKIGNAETAFSIFKL